MSHGAGYPLAAKYSSATPADQAAVSIPGGRYVIVTDATTWPTTAQVQVQCQNGSWANVGSNLTAAGISSGIDLPAGQYRAHLASGTSTALSIDLVRIPY